MIKWKELVSEDQLPKYKYFLVGNINDSNNYLDIELMINDRWDHKHEENIECGMCGDEKESIYESNRCIVNYFEPNIKGRYTHFAIIDFDSIDKQNNF